MTVTFKDTDAAQFTFTATEDSSGLALAYSSKGRVPFLGTVSLPTIKKTVPREGVFEGMHRAVKALPAAVEPEAEAAIDFVMALLKESCAAQVTVTFGDRLPDGKLDVTVEVSYQLPGAESQDLKAMTFTPPIAEALDGITLAAAALPFPAAVPVATLGVALLKGALHALHIA